MQHLTYMVVVSLAQCRGGGKDWAQACGFACVLVSLPDQWPLVFGLGTRLHVRMRAKLENGILRNGQQLQCTVNGQVLKTLCIVGSAHWGTHCISAKTTVSTWTVLELTWLNKLWWWQKWHFCYHTLLCLAVFWDTSGKLCESVWL